MTTAATPKVTGAVQSRQTIELQSRTKATHKVAVQAGQAIQIVVDGQPYTGQKKIKDRNKSAQGPHKF